MKTIFGRLIIPSISLGLLIFSIYHILNAQTVKEQTAPPAYPPRSPYKSTISASGIVEPQSENIAIGTPLSGVVAEVFTTVDRVGDSVKVGDPLFRVDDRHLKAQLAVQKANLLVPKAQLEKLELMPRPEEIEPARQSVAAAKANLTKAIDSYTRLSKLALSRAVTEAEVVSARQEKEFAEAELSRVQAQLTLLEAGAWEPDKAIARANIAQMEAEILRIETEIDRSLVRSPVDGVILQVNVRPGEFIGTPAASNLIVLGQMRLPRVRADIDENDIPRFDPKQSAKAVVRGQSSKELPLRFVRVEPYVVPKRSLTGGNTERVDTRVLQVIYELESPEPNIYVGQQVDLFISADGR